VLKKQTQVILAHLLVRQISLNCGGAIKVITSIEDPVVVEKILSQLNEKKSVVDRTFYLKIRHASTRLV
jgi:hypothetical protein